MIFYPALLTGLLLSALLSALIFASLAWNPRLWLHHAPREWVEAVPPLDGREKRHRVCLAVVFFALLFGVPLAGGGWLQADLGRRLGFGEAAFFFWVAWMTFNLVDLVLIDWLVLVVLQPKAMFPRGVEHLLHLNAYRMHLLAFGKGTAGLSLASLLFGGLWVWLW